jgi:hypothetical protein
MQKQAEGTLIAPRRLPEIKVEPRARLPAGLGHPWDEAMQSVLAESQT